MINVGANYGKSTKCPFLCDSIDDQQHLFQCEFLKEDSQVYNYKDIYSDDPKKFISITDTAQKLIRKREENLAH